MYKKAYDIIKLPLCKHLSNDSFKITKGKPRNSVPTSNKKLGRNKQIIYLSSNACLLLNTWINSANVSHLSLLSKHDKNRFRFENHIHFHCFLFSVIHL